MNGSFPKTYRDRDMDILVSTIPVDVLCIFDAQKMASKYVRHRLDLIDTCDTGAVEGIYLSMAYFQKICPSFVLHVYLLLVKHISSSPFQKKILPTWTREQRHLMHYMMEQLYELTMG